MIRDDQANKAQESEPKTRLEALRAQLHQLILMRETGPKRPTWHAARMRLIWRLHDQIAREQINNEQQSLND
jgi:hypothetical protein